MTGVLDVAVGRLCAETVTSAIQRLMATPSRLQLQDAHELSLEMSREVHWRLAYVLLGAARESLLNMMTNISKK